MIFHTHTCTYSICPGGLYVHADMNVDHQGVDLELPPLPQIDLTERGGIRGRGRGLGGEAVPRDKVVGGGKHSRAEFPKFTPQTAMILNVKSQKPEKPTTDNVQFKIIKLRH